MKTLRKGEIYGVKVSPVEPNNIMAISDDRITIFDLRNQETPLKTITSNTIGVIDSTWCPFNKNLFVFGGLSGIISQKIIFFNRFFRTRSTIDGNR